MIITIMQTTNSQFVSKPAGSIKTKWEIITYDVWGNAKDGFEVNDLYKKGTTEEFAAKTKHNIGTSSEFESASLSEKQIKKIFGVKCFITVDGDDITYYIRRNRDDYPIGELRCVSHESLSPIRVKNP